MGDIVRRLVWFGIVSCAFSYATFLVLGNVVNAQGAGAYDPILVRDVLSPGTHHLSGMVMVPSACDQLSMTTEQIATTTYALLFTTWREPTVSCDAEEIPRAFREVVFAPAAGVQFVASLDGASFPLAVLPVSAEE